MNFYFIYFMDYIISLEDIFQAYFECRKNKRRTANALMFEADYETLCVQLWKDINEGTYNIGKSIAFIVTKPKPREVFAATFRDRVVHHLIANRLEPLFEEYFINDIYNCRKGKGTLYGIKRLYEQVKLVSNNFKEDCYIAKFDLKGFFTSIDKTILNSMLQQFIDARYFGKDKSIIKDLVEKIVMHCPEKNCYLRSNIKKWRLIPKSKSLFYNGDLKGLAIGNLTSQLFANFFLAEFDSIESNKFQGYGRYVDDFFIVCKDKNSILNNIEHMKDFLYNKLNVTLHPNKVYLQHFSKGVKFIGAVIKSNRMYTGNATVSNFHKRVDYFNYIIENRDIKMKDIKKFLSVINSYLGFIKHYKSFNIKKSLIKYISYKWWDYCHVSDNFCKICINN